MKLGDIDLNGLNMTQIGAILGQIRYIEVITPPVLRTAADHVRTAALSHWLRERAQIEAGHLGWVNQDLMNLGLPIPSPVPAASLLQDSLTADAGSDLAYRLLAWPRVIELSAALLASIVIPPASPDCSYFQQKNLAESPLAHDTQHVIASLTSEQRGDVRQEIEQLSVLLATALTEALDTDHHGGRAVA